jgi:MoxR-like ATPase
VQALVQHTRESGHFEAGLSPRAAIALLRASQAWALLHGRPGVVPEDVQAVVRAVAGHRLELRTAVDGSHAANLDRLLLEAVAVP